MRRKNFDPNGDRHPELRGKDEYVRISWDEALDLVAGEITRIRETYGPAAITAMTSSHHNWGFLHYKLGPLGRFFNILGYSQCLDNPDSWEGWHWGATHAWGYWWRLGHCEQSELLQDALKNTEQIIFWSVDPNSTSYMYSGQENLIWRHWMKELGIQFVVIDPLQQLHRQHHGRQVDRPAAGHRRGAGRGHRATCGSPRTPTTTSSSRTAPTVLTNGRSTSWARARTRRPRPRSGRRRSATSRLTPSRLWPASGRPRRPCWPWPASSAPPAPAARPTPPSGAGCASTSWPCRASASRESTSGAAPARARPWTWASTCSATPTTAGTPSAPWPRSPTSPRATR